MVLHTLLNPTNYTKQAYVYSFRALHRLLCSVRKLCLAHTIFSTHMLPCTDSLRVNACLNIEECAKVERCGHYLRLALGRCNIWYGVNLDKNSAIFLSGHEEHAIIHHIGNKESTEDLIKTEGMTNSVNLIKSSIEFLKNC